MDWSMLVSVAYAADALGIQQEVNLFKLAFQGIIAVVSGIIISWRGAGVLAGHSREIAEVLGTIMVGLLLIIVLPNWVQARIGAGATGTLVAAGSQFVESLGSFSLVILPQWLLAGRLWLTLRRRWHF